MSDMLQGKTALITGGSSGIGEAIAIQFKSEGAAVHVIDINEGSLDAVSYHKCDITDTGLVADVIKGISKSGLDILVNNAGIAHVGKIEDTSAEDLDRLYRVNIKGVYNCTKPAIEYFKLQSSGVILNVASVASHVAVADRFAYSMTKGAVLTMTYSIAKDYVDHGIRCNSISPARVHTPFVDGFIKKNYPGNEDEMFANLSATQPIGRMGLPEEIAYLAVFLCSDKSQFITGTDFPIDGGFIKLNC